MDKIQDFGQFVPMLAQFNRVSWCCPPPGGRRQGISDPLDF